MWDKDWDHFTSKNVCLVPQRLLKRPSLVPLYCGVSSVINKVVMYIGLLLAHHLFCCFIHTSLWNTLLSSLLKIYNIVTSTSIPLSAFFFFKDYLCYSQTIIMYIYGKSCSFSRRIFHDFNWDGFENTDQFGRSWYLCSMVSFIYYLGVWLHSLGSLSVFQTWGYFLEISHVFCYICSWVFDVLMLYISS